MDFLKSEFSAKILCVEDDPALARLIQLNLERLNYHVTLATDGEHGLALCEAGGFDIVLIDYLLPKMDGLELIHKLAEMPQSPPSIMISGTAAINVPVEAMKLGAADYIIKHTGNDFFSLLPVTIERVLEQKKLLEERARIQSELRLSAAVFEHTTEAIMVTDCGNIIQLVNPSFTDITGYTEAEVVGKHTRFLDSSCNDIAHLNEMASKLTHAGFWRGEVWSLRKNGSDFPTQLAVSSISNEAGELTHYVNLFCDITERRQREQQFWHKANFDALTELPNRELFMDRLSQTFHLAQRKHSHGALLFIDLDYFKQVNDTHGHAAGDKVLQIIAQRLKSCTREVDTAARLSGDEFTLVLADVEPPESAMKIAEKIRKQISQPITLPDHSKIRVGCSIGSASFPNEVSDINELIRNADAAMYAAKAAGRNQVKLVG